MSIQEAWAEFVQHYDAALQDERDAAGSRSLRGSQPWVHDRARNLALASAKRAAAIQAQDYIRTQHGKEPELPAFLAQIEQLGLQPEGGSDE